MMAEADARCAECGAAFVCGAAAGLAECWCAGLPPLANIEPERSCLCPACLALKLKAELGAELAVGSSLPG
jgi:hypothetical protein